VIIRFNSTDRAVLTTLAYADIFDFPLTAQEIFRYCIGKRVTGKSVRKSLSHLSGMHADEKTFFTLSKRNTILSTRRQRGRESFVKWRVAVRTARFLAYIPSIMFVGVTGALAIGNAGREDDIDIFIVVKRKTLWVTRILTVLSVEILGNRRHPNQKEVANSICLNMFVSEDGLAIPHDDRDVYAAHEALQMVPVWEQKGAYKRFLDSNKWVRRYLPNWWGEKKHALSGGNAEGTICVGGVLSFGPLLPIILFVFRLFEPIAKQIQVSYMQKRRTNEVICDTVVRFHPRDTRGYVREQLHKRLTPLKIPLDNVFVMSIK